MYYTNVTIGTPGIMFTVIVDTGSGGTNPPNVLFPPRVSVLFISNPLSLVLSCKASSQLIFLFARSIDSQCVV